jgi:hypothetical protein
MSEQRPDAHGIDRQDAALMLILAILALVLAVAAPMDRTPLTSPNRRAQEREPPLATFWPTFGEKSARCRAIVEPADNDPILPLRRNCKFLNRLAISFLLGLRIDHAQVLALLSKNVD